MAQRFIVTVNLVASVAIAVLTVSTGCGTAVQASPQPAVSEQPQEASPPPPAEPSVAEPPLPPTEPPAPDMAAPGNQAQPPATPQPLGAAPAAPVEMPPAAPADEAPHVVTPPSPISESPLEAVERILALSDDEMDALRVAQAHKADYLETAFYMILDKARQLPPLADEQLHQLPRPAYRSLLQHPEPYVGRPIRISVLVYSVFKETSGEDHAPDLQWPRGRVKWMIRCFDADSRHGQQPLLIVSTVDPLPLLHQPINDPDEPLKIFNPRFARLEVAGVFYKIFQAEEAGLSDEPARPRSRLGPPPTVRDYPFVVAWQLGKPLGIRSTPLPMAMVGTIVMALIALLVAFCFLTRRIRRIRNQPLLSKAGAARSLWPDKYHPLRDANQDNLSPHDRGEDDEVDPQLRAAVEKWRKDHREDQPDG